MSDMLAATEICPPSLAEFLENWVGKLLLRGPPTGELTENPTLRASRRSTLGLRIEGDSRAGRPFVARTSEPFLGGDREYPQEPEIMDMMAPYEKDEREDRS